MSCPRIRKLCGPIRKDSPRSGRSMHFPLGSSSAVRSTPILPFLLLTLRLQKRGCPSATTRTRARKQRRPWMKRAISHVKSTCWSRPAFMKRIRIGERPLKPIRLYSAFSQTISNTGCNWRTQKLLGAGEKTRCRPWPLWPLWARRQETTRE